MHVDTFAQVQELVRIIKLAGPLRTKVFSREKMSDETVGYARLYKIIASDLTATEAEVSKKAFGVGPKDNAYLIQRSTLKEILLNTLFALDTEQAGFSQYGAAVYENDKDMFATRILQTLSWPYSVKLAQQSLPVALGYERWHNALLFLDAIREGAAISGDMSEFDRVDAEFQRVLSIYETSQFASSAMDRITCISAKSSSEDPRLAEIATPAIARLRKALKVTPCYTLNLLLWRLETAKFQSTSRYHEALKATRTFESLVKRSYPQFLNNSLIASFARKRLTCATRVRDHAEALKALHIERALLDPNDALNVILSRQREFILMMHTGDYQRAAEIVQEVESSGKLIHVPAVHRDKWKIFDAYARLALQDSSLKFNRRNLDARLQKDKAGTNAAAILLELLLLVRMNKLDELHSRAEAIESYVKRHLTGEENRQIRRFFELVLLVVQTSDDRARFAKRAEKYLKEDREDRSSDPIAGFQLVPTDVLWQWLFNWTENRPS